MTLFVDASALVAIATQEDGYQQLADRIAEDGSPLWSAISRWEAVRAVARQRELTIEEAGRIVDNVTDGLFVLVEIGEAEAHLALEAHRRYGKGNHDARLNMGDCFAYACTRAHGAKLLYKGDDFALTDLA